MKKSAGLAWFGVVQIELSLGKEAGGRARFLP